MNRKVIGLCLSLGLMSLLAGCAGKNVSSSSGDQSGKAKSETIQPDAIKTVPMERSFDRPSGNASTLATEPGVTPDTNALADIFFE